MVCIKMELSVIIPAYNEERRIEGALKNYINFFDNKKIKYEIIVVCNDCSDNTVDIVKKLIKKNKKIKLLDYKEKIRKGGAVLEGFMKAEGNFIGFLDADDSFDLEIVYKNLIKNLSKYDCVIASKWKNQGFFDVNEGFARKILSRGWNILVRILFNLHFKDTQAGAKFLTRGALNSINLNFLCRGFEFDVELLARLAKKGNKIKEVYIPNRMIEGSKFNTKYIPSMFWNLLRLWARL